MTYPSWLPEALQYGDFNGEWEKFLAAVYQIFERDFKHSRPGYLGKSVVHDSKIENGKEAAFWHLISRDDPRTGNREMDIRRCERVLWPRPIIEHLADNAVSVWKVERKKADRKSQTRVLIWLENLDYLVVLAERPKAMVLITAYCTDIESQREKLRRERDEYFRKQKPPRVAT